MKKAIIVLLLVVIFSTCDISHGATSDKQLALNWANSHGGGYTIEKVITVSKGGKTGKVKGTKYIVKYPKKVKKGKKVTCYMVEKNGEVYAMVCLGKVKA
jgi:predicted transcriptional regulator YheO